MIRLAVFLMCIFCLASPGLAQSGDVAWQIWADAQPDSRTAADSRQRSQNRQSLLRSLQSPLAVLVPDGRELSSITLNGEILTLAMLPAHKGHTGSLYLLPSEAEPARSLSLTVSTPAPPIPAVPVLVGNYSALQSVLQQRDILFWQLPAWAAYASAFLVLVMWLAWSAQFDSRLHRTLFQAQLTACVYLCCQLGNSVLWLLAGYLSMAVWALLLVAVLLHNRRLSGVLPSPAARQSVVFAAVLLLLLILVDAGLGLFFADAGLGLYLADAELRLFLADATLELFELSLAVQPGMYLPLPAVGQVVMILAVLYLLVSQHVNNQVELTQLNVSLDQRVQRATGELERRYAEMKADALDAAGLHERKVIFQSLHEDLSDKLLHLIYTAADADAEELARAALKDLRDTRNLQSESQQNLGELMADVRNEIDTRCEQAGVNPGWHLSDSLYATTLTALQASCVTRTLREALSNVLKHASAASVQIGAELTAGQLHYSVSDDGHGIRPSPMAGRGLANMQNRVRDLGGSMQVTSSSAAGTTLSFSLPVEQP
ncbi:hypothetical protein PHACT_06200 [Pseudohongiella acticola]|uniref:histidine kinase n=2 Tax=Pseudohongiella acticola TaxID=1524254 RepID=A0A1E8CK22_9GAMM|nr:hypothetical protein PHACT_06200 [Pseudohongiella acticola]